jgi:hypothetical protein
MRLVIRVEKVGRIMAVMSREGRDVADGWNKNLPPPDEGIADASSAMDAAMNQ